MNSVKGEEAIQSLYSYAAAEGFPEDLFLSAANLPRYIDTAIDAYRDYPLFQYLFRGKYDEKTFCRMMSVDLTSRLSTMAGIAGGPDCASVMLIEPPMNKRVGMLQYFKVAAPADYTLLLKPVMYRLEDYERFARQKRTAWLDEATWYIYIFATKQEYQHRGYGRKLMELMISYAEQTGSRICLETNLADNVGLYEHFGFRTVETTVYGDALEHYVMLFQHQEDGLI